MTALTAVLLYVIFTVLVWLSMVSLGILLLTEWLDDDDDVWTDRMEFLGKFQPLEEFK
jgi:hypothetical protein